MRKTPGTPLVTAAALLEADPAPSLKRYYIMAFFESNMPKARATVSGVYRWPAIPEHDHLRQILEEGARRIFAGRGHPDALPTNFSMDNPPMELPEAPVPLPADQRPLKRWSVSAEMVCHDIKFGAPVEGVFKWPEQPSASVLNQTVYFLMSEAVLSRGDHPGYAQESEVRNVRVEPVTEG